LPKSKERRSMEQLALIAFKNKIDADSFFNLMMEAWHKEEAEYQSLAVTCRQKTKESAFFLFTVGGKILAQFPISTKTLQRDLKRYLKYRLGSVRRGEWPTQGIRGRPSQEY